MCVSHNGIRFFEPLRSILPIPGGFRQSDSSIGLLPTAAPWPVEVLIPVALRGCRHPSAVLSVLDPIADNTAKHCGRGSVHDRLHQLPRTEPLAPGQLRMVALGLWACPDEPPGGPANTCGFLLQRQAGNAFACSSSKVESYYDQIDELGGVAIVLLNHRDEAARHDAGQPLRRTCASSSSRS